jgi:hypothetical protein
MESRIKLSTADPLVKALLRVSFPNYRGRKVSASAWRGPLSLDLNWDGGSRDYVVLIDFAAERIGRLVSPSPWARGAHDPVDAPPGSILAVHSIFCGRDVGVTFYVRPASDGAKRLGVG